MKTIINSFWQNSIINGKSFFNFELNEKLQRAQFIVGLFYFFVLFVSFQTFSSFSLFPEWDVLINSKDLFEPIWSVQWISLEHWEFTIRAIMLSFFGFAILGALFWERSVLVRIGVFLSMFVYLSLISSFGKIDHFMHVMMVSSFLLIFLPKSRTTEAKRDFLKIIFGIQTLILVAYFISGVFKFYGILDQELKGVVSALSQESLAITLSKTSLASNSDYFFSSLILNSKSAFFPAVLIFGFLVEFFSIYVIFKPHYHRIWGFLLVLLHAGILLTVGPDFRIQAFMVGIFLFFSPFSTAILPPIKSPLAYFRNRKKKNSFVVFYDGECLMCNGFLKFLSKYDLPAEMKICKLQSDLFREILAESEDLSEVDSIIVVEQDETGAKFIRIKANAIVWTLSKTSKRFLLLKFLYQVFPFPGNCVYDIVAKRRKKIEPDNCPIPPQNIRERMIPENETGFFSPEN